MSHLNLRTCEGDEKNLRKLCKLWKVNRSEATRIALATAVSFLEKRKSKKELLASSHFVGGFKASPSLSSDYKMKVKKSIQRKYGRKK